MIKGYYFISGGVLSKKGHIDDVRNAVEAGVSVIQYRNKEGTSAEMLSEARKIRELCRGRTFLVNDRVDIAACSGADGVHIGKEDLPYDLARKILGPDAVIGVSVDNIEEAVKAEAAGADYLGVGPVFYTATKTDAGEPVGIALVKEIKKKCGIPVVAIGGIDLLNAAGVVYAGADALCAISAVLTKDDVKREILKYQGLFEHSEKEIKERI